MVYNTAAVLFLDDVHADQERTGGTPPAHIPPLLAAVPHLPPPSNPAGHRSIGPGDFRGRRAGLLRGRRELPPMPRASSGTGATGTTDADPQTWLADLSALEAADGEWLAWIAVELRRGWSAPPDVLVAVLRVHAQGGPVPLPETLWMEVLRDHDGSRCDRNVLLTTRALAALYALARVVYGHHPTSVDDGPPMVYREPFWRALELPSLLFELAHGPTALATQSFRNLWPSLLALSAAVQPERVNATEGLVAEGARDALAVKHRAALARHYAAVASAAPGYSDSATFTFQTAWLRALACEPLHRLPRHTGSVLKTLLPQLVDAVRAGQELGPALRSALERVVRRLALQDPATVWLGVYAAMRRRQLVGTVATTWAELASDPLRLFECDPILLRQPAFFSLLARALQCALAAGRASLGVLARPARDVHALLLLQEASVAQRLLELCSLPSSEDAARLAESTSVGDRCCALGRGKRERSCR